jgi:hypothetical protein
VSTGGSQAALLGGTALEVRICVNCLFARFASVSAPLRIPSPDRISAEVLEVATLGTQSAGHFDPTSNSLLVVEHAALSGAPTRHCCWGIPSQ